MNILIIGLGVIGSTYGFLFKQAGHHVEHYLRNESHKKGTKQLSVSLLGESRLKEFRRRGNMTLRFVQRNDTI